MPPPASIPRSTGLHIERRSEHRQPPIRPRLASNRIIVAGQANYNLHGFRARNLAGATALQGDADQYVALQKAEDGATSFVPRARQTIQASLTFLCRLNREIAGDAKNCADRLSFEPSAANTIPFW